MRLSVPFVIVCCVFALFAACKKKENRLSERGSMLVAGKWQVSAYTATLNYMGKDSTFDLYSQIADCDKDDFIVYGSDGVATADESTNKCANDDQIEHANWALLSSDTKLALLDNNPDTFDLDITSTQMKLKQTKPNSSGTPVTYVHTYKNIK